VKAFYPPLVKRLGFSYVYSLGSTGAWSWTIWRITVGFVLLTPTV
jgi:hypothetical protein